MHKKNYKHHALIYTYLFTGKAIRELRELPKPEMKNCESALKEVEQRVGESSELNTLKKYIQNSIKEMSQKPSNRGPSLK